MLKLEVIAGLFALYVIVVTVMMRSALTTSDVTQRTVEAKRLLLVVTLGVPLAIAAIFYLM
jgi:hypothetical protein